MPSVAIDERRFATMEAAVGEIRDAVVAIARLEEKHQETRESLLRSFDRIEELERTQNAHAVELERIRGEIAPLKESRNWIVAAMLAVVGAAGFAVLKVVGV